jgi:glycosyltransferase involved in cell wall biosynthesis
MKYRILVIHYPKIGGCQFFRQIHPHDGMKGAEFEIDYQCFFHLIPSHELTTYHMVQFHKNYVNVDVLNYLKGLGIVTMVDFDDYWKLPGDHIFYKAYQRNGQAKKYIEILKTADYITCTTNILAKYIKEHNTNVFVLPNVLDGYHPDARLEINTNNKVCFGYLAGSAHKPDIELLRGLNNTLNNYKLDYELHLFGYRHDNIYFDYAKILTNGSRYCNNLVLHPPAPCPGYLTYYNTFDVSLVPLRVNLFNTLKSELKLIEAANFKMPVIASDTYPYRPYLKHMRNSLVANSKSDWPKRIRYFINNPSAVKDFGEQLHLDVQKKFNYGKTIEKRKETYRSILSGG